jgi:hypothetical protein
MDPARLRIDKLGEILANPGNDFNWAWSRLLPWNSLKLAIVWRLGWSFIFRLPFVPGAVKVCLALTSRRVEFGFGFGFGFVSGFVLFWCDADDQFLRSNIYIRCEAMQSLKEARQCFVNLIVITYISFPGLDQDRCSSNAAIDNASINHSVAGCKVCPRAGYFLGILCLLNWTVELS